MYDHFIKFVIACLCAAVVVVTVTRLLKRLNGRRGGLGFETAEFEVEAKAETPADKAAPKSAKDEWVLAMEERLKQLDQAESAETSDAAVRDAREEAAFHPVAGADEVPPPADEPPAVQSAEVARGGFEPVAATKPSLTDRLERLNGRPVRSVEVITPRMLSPEERQAVIDRCNAKGRQAAPATAPVKTKVGGIAVNGWTPTPAPAVVVPADEVVHIGEDPAETAQADAVTPSHEAPAAPVASPATKFDKSRRGAYRAEGFEPSSVGTDRTVTQRGLHRTGGKEVAVEVSRVRRGPSNFRVTMPEHHGRRHGNHASGQPASDDKRTPAKA